MGAPAVKILPNYQKLGPVGSKLLPFAQMYAEKLGKELNFNALFRNAVIDLYLANKKFTVQVFNPQSFGAVNNYNHRVGDVVRDKMVETMVKFYKSKGINAKVFVIQGINRAVLLEGVSPAEVAKYAVELKAAMEAREYKFEIAPKDIENPQTKEAFKEYIAKKKGIPKTQVGESVKYTVDIKDAPKVKTDGTVVKAFKISVGEMHYDPAKAGAKKYSPVDVENATSALLNKLNQDNPAKVQEASLDVILKNTKLVSLKSIELGPDALAAVKEFAGLKKLQKLVLGAPDLLYAELGAFYKKSIPEGLQGQVKSIEISKGSGTKTSPYIAAGGEIVVPLIDASGKSVAEVRIYGKEGSNFTSLSPKLGQLFSLQKRTLGGLAFKWNADLYLDPKSSLYNGKAYYAELAKLHASKTNYILVRGDINYFGSWMGFNKDYSVLGTELGDAVFKDFADRAQKFFKANGISVKIARLGGDELALTFTGKELSREAVTAKLQEFGKEMKSAELKHPISKDALPEAGQKSLMKYVEEFDLKPNADGSYTVDLYKFERYAQKYNKLVKGMGVSFGVHNEVDPAKVEAVIKAQKPGIAGAELAKKVQKFIHQMDAEADAIASHAKNGNKNGSIKIALDKRDGVRIVVDETDPLVKEKGPDLHLIDGKKIKNTAELVKAIAETPEGSIIFYEGAVRIKIRAKAKYFKAWLMSSDPKKAEKAFAQVVKATAKANKGVPPAFIAGFLAGKKAELAPMVEASGKYVEISLPFQKIVASREALLEKLTTFKFETEGSSGEKISVSVKIKDAQDLFSVQVDVRKAAKERIVKEIQKAAPKAKSAEVFKALETHLTVMKTSYQLNEYMNTKLAKVYADAYLKELDAALSEIKGADAKKAAELLAKIEKRAAEAVEAHRVGFEAKANEYIKGTGKKSLTDADLKKIWKNLEGEKLIKEGKYAEFHGATMAGLGKVAVRTAKDGALGLGVGAVLEGFAELTAKDPSFTNWLKNTGKSGLHWAQFGLMCGAGEHLLGWSPVKAMGAAMVLPALWDLSKVPYAAKGQVLVSHAAGLGGFVFGMKVAGWTKAAKIPKVGGLAGLALGMGGAWGLGKLNAYAYGKSETWRDIVDSKFMKTTGAVLGDTEKLVTYWCGVGLASSALAGVAAGLVYYDALGVSLGVEATLGGYSAGLSSTAGILSTAAGALIVLAAVKGGFSLHYHLANGDYEKSIAERLGKSLMEYMKYKDSQKILTMLGWALTEILGGKFKYDQFVERFARYFGSLPGKMVEYKDGVYTEYQKKYLEGIIEFIGNDFKDSLSLGKNMALDYAQAAFKYLLKENGLTGNADADYNMALAHVKSLAAGLSKEIILSEKEQGIYKKVMGYLQSHKVSGFKDPNLVSFVAGLSSVGSKPHAKAVLKRIELAMTQNQIKYMLLVDPKNMGKDLYGMLSFHLKMYAKKGEAEAQYKKQMAEFEKQHPEIAKKVKNGENLTAGERWIYTNATMKMANPGLFNTPFAGTPIMKMGKVQKLHDQIAKFFDEKGRLKPGKAEAFAKWVLSRKVGGKDFKEKLVETEKKFKEIRANQLLVAALKGKEIKTTPQDVKLGLVDKAGNLKLDNPYIKKGLDKVRAKIVKDIAKERKAAAAKLKTANAKAKKWQMKHVYWKKKQLTLLSKDAADPAALAKVEKKLAYIGKKLMGKMKNVAIAEAKVKSLKLALTSLQKKWKAESDPLKKAILAAQIKGLAA